MAPNRFEVTRGRWETWSIAKSSVGRGGKYFTKVVCGISKNQN